MPAGDAGAPSRQWPPRWRQVTRGLAGVALGAALLVWGLPRVTGASWPQTAAIIAKVPPLQLAGLFALQLAALGSYAVVLAAALPGLSVPRALLLNLAGSAVSMLVPFGGALGVAATYLIARSWGFTAGAVGLAVVVTGLWNVLAKLAVPVVGLAALAGAGQQIDPRLSSAAVLGAVIVAVVLAGVIAVLSLDRVAAVADRWAARLLGRWVRAGMVVGWRDRSRDILRDGWVRMTAGMVGFFGLYGVLFWASLQAVAAAVPPTAAIAAYTLGRLLTSVVITPGGLGIAESGAAGLLVALGAHADTATAGVLLFAAYTQLLQVPLGALAWGVWALTRRRQPRPAQ